MFDEEIETDQPEVPEEVTPEEVPAAESEDEIFARLLKAKGIDPENFDPKEVANLGEWKKDLNRKSTDLGALARQLEAAKPAAKEAAPEYDPETLTDLTGALKALGIDPAAVKQAMGLTTASISEGVEDTFEAFTTEHADIDPMQLIERMTQAGHDLETITPRKLRSALTDAYKLIKADSIDEKAIEERGYKRALEELAAKGVRPEDVVEVKKGRGAAAGAHKSLAEMLDDPDTSMFDKMDAFAG